MLHGDGTPLLIEYKDDDMHICYVVMKSDICTCKSFGNLLRKGELFDFETPYGYGGPLIQGMVTEKSQKTFLEELKTYCLNNSIVSQFVRFHPLLHNHDKMLSVFETRYLRDTIYIDTKSSDEIMRNMDSKNRNMVRKALKSGVTIEEKPVEQYKEFIKMYDDTMRRDQADEYYTFREDYFIYQKTLKENARIFYAMMDGKAIAGSIIYYNDNYVHYHLSGSYEEYRKYAPSNLLLYEIANWASRKGIKAFHLGGGMSPDDSLFGFKKQFNKNGRLPYVVGRTIFDKESYDRLLCLRKDAEQSFDVMNNRMIQYRA